MLNMSISNRINQRLKALNLSGVDVSKSLKVTSGAVSQWCNGGSHPSAGHLLNLSTLLQCSPQWLQSGEGLSPNLVQETAQPYTKNVRHQSSIEGDAVDLALLVEKENTLGSGLTQIVILKEQTLRFPQSIFEQQNVNTENAACCQVTGNAMEPILPGGSTVILDQSKTLIEDGKLYVINHGGRLRVKKLYSEANSVRIHSTHHDYQDLILSGEDLKHFNILGKVIWSASFHT